MKTLWKSLAPRLALLPMCLPLALVVFSLVEVQPIRSPQGFSAEVIAGIAAFATQFFVALAFFDRIRDWQHRASTLFCQPPTAVYVIATAALTSIAFGVRWPHLAVVGLIASSVPMWFRNGSIAATLFWIVAALPFTFYSLFLSLFLVGLPLLGLTWAMWKTVAWHWHTPDSPTSRTSVPAMGHFFGATLSATFVIVLVTLVLTAGRFPLFNLEWAII